MEVSEIRKMLDSNSKRWTFYLFPAKALRLVGGESSIFILVNSYLGTYNYDLGKLHNREKCLRMYDENLAFELESLKLDIIAQLQSQ